MHNLIYLSTASYLYNRDELTGILHTSRVNNARRNITGLLLYNEGSILQVLEGEKEALDALFTTISNDERHRNIIKIIDAGIERRNFQDWSMGFMQLSNEDWSALNGYLNIGNKNAFQQIAAAGSTPVITMINAFASVNRLDHIHAALK